jgi:hypothetical protein
MTYYVNVYEIPGDGRRWLGNAVGTKTLSDELARKGNALYRIRVTPKEPV